MEESELRKILPNASDSEINHILNKMNNDWTLESHENEIADDLNYMHEAWEGSYS